MRLSVGPEQAPLAGNLLISTHRLHKRGDEWVHPETGATSPVTGDGDMFVIYLSDNKVELGREMREEFLSLVVDRATLEIIGQGIEDALTRDPVLIRRA